MRVCPRTNKMEHLFGCHRMVPLDFFRVAAVEAADTGTLEKILGEVKKDSEIHHVAASYIGIAWLLPARNTKGARPRHVFPLLFGILFDTHMAVGHHLPGSPVALIFQLLLPNYGLLVDKVAGKKRLLG